MEIYLTENCAYEICQKLNVVFTRPQFHKRGIVDIEVSPPPPFLPSPLLNQQTVQAPPFRQSPLYIDLLIFQTPPPKSQIFQ